MIIVSVKVKGFDQLQTRLQRLQRNAETLSGTQEVSFDKLFTPSFMIRYTNTATFDDFLNSGGYHVNSKEDFEAIPDKEFDAYVKENTKFNSWHDMLQAAAQAYVISQLKV